MTTTPAQLPDVEDLTVRGDPDKRFFIENLIKDIELIPAILDLVDNSVDAARSVALTRLSIESIDNTGETLDPPMDLTKHAFDGLVVELEISATSFVVSDNCTGMPVDTARNYAFRIGRSKDFVGVEGSVGEFGVGMKRALFKLGRWFEVQSRCDTEGFNLTVDLDIWMDEQDERDWSFRFASVHRHLKVAAESERGTRIEVRRLHESVTGDFSNDLFLSLVREQLRLRHQEAIDHGLSIRLNGELLLGLRPELISGPELGAIRRVFLIDVGRGVVNVEIIAGIVRTNRRELNVNDSRAENFRKVDEAGWWVFGNNRLLLLADKSLETGWGNGAANYHPQYRLFRGYVYMSSLDTNLIPWNTTKTGVDADSAVWRQVQSNMVATLVEVQAVLNRIKLERESELDEEQEVEPEDTPYLRGLERATATPIRQLPMAQMLRVPAPPPKKASRPKPAIWQRLQFDVPREQADHAMSELGLATLKELGRRSFDYFYKREVEDA